MNLSDTLTDESAREFLGRSKYPLLADTALTLYNYYRKSMGVEAAFKRVKQELMSDHEIDAIRARPFDLL